MKHDHIYWAHLNGGCIIKQSLHLRLCLLGILESLPQSFWHSVVPFLRVSNGYYFWLLNYWLAFIKFKKALMMEVWFWLDLNTLVYSEALPFPVPHTQTHSIPRILVLPKYFELLTWCQAPVFFNKYRFKLYNVRGPLLPILVSWFFFVKF